LTPPTDTAYSGPAWRSRLSLNGGVILTGRWETAGRHLDMPATIGRMDPACEYPNCREVATTVIVIEFGYGSIDRRVCSGHAAQAKTIAKQHDGIAYRLYPL
jgi:hypothetical protein